MGVWLPEKTMDATSTKLMSKKDIDQYSESTMIAVFEIKDFETPLLLPEIKEHPYHKHRSKTCLSHLDYQYW